jgi:hypothetical protein
MKWRVQRACLYIRDTSRKCKIVFTIYCYCGRFVEDRTIISAGIRQSCICCGAVWGSCRNCRGRVCALYLRRKRADSSWWVCSVTCFISFISMISFIASISRCMALHFSADPMSSPTEFFSRLSLRRTYLLPYLPRLVLSPKMALLDLSVNVQSGRSMSSLCFWSLQPRPLIDCSVK